MGEWNKPIAKLYPDFEGWLKGRADHYKAYLDDARKTLKYSWYKAGSSIGIDDKKDYNSKLFPTKLIQEGYKNYLKGAGVQGDPSTQKFQSGNIMGDEMAFYIRHAPICDLMTCGFMEGTIYPFIEDLYKNHVKKTRGLSDLSRDLMKGN